MRILGVQNLYDKYVADLSDYQTMWNYYKGETDIGTTYKRSKLGNNRIVKANFIKKFINEEVAFGTGNPITYTRELNIDEILNNIDTPVDTIETKIINTVMNNNDANTDSQLMKNLLVFGEAMELYYIKNNSFKIKELNSLNCYVNLDENNEIIEAIYVYSVANKDQINTTFTNKLDTRIDYITNSQVITYDIDFNQLNVKPHYFGVVPIGYCNLIDGIYNTLFTDLKTLQDNIENVLSDFSNEIGDSRLSYLILKNMGLSDEEIVDEKGNRLTLDEQAKKIISMFRDNGILLLNDSKENPANADYLIKNINPQIHKNLLDILQDDIYQISQHINLNQQQSSNTSGVALMTRIIALRNKIKIQQNCMTQAIKKRILCMLTALNKIYSQNLDATKVGIKYTLNVPSDDSAMADIITKLVPGGILSAETGLSNLSFVNNPKLEYQKAQAEQQEKINSMPGLEGPTNETV
ncbi:phage portal protein [Clostridium thermobutyricum]|uniref:Phage portal protein, SPP1 Gp6-like n=1 Tax=Clostridium thermobutyricum DSM 4928 TaxID=1121339 RepID=A0A1V4SXF0_9CLOT|nr:phage portal protein [Clostridium thermobutyricum]OPX48489.1 phage portal protein, SPP1 Gp6-like [Clostridium thermobutyricum DSM 4928]